MTAACSCRQPRSMPFIEGARCRGCIACAGYVSLGPATETDRTTIEIIAAEWAPRIDEARAVRDADPHGDRCPCIACEAFYLAEIIAWHTFADQLIGIDGHTADLERELAEWDGEGAL